ncbi:hypothetical protein [Ochrobactrum sp. A-1]|uniref:hypothetical protein n=1 Tax=Ochrobactrum sp. A-1 TaxID=2920940 RepID=UPI001F0B6DBA|nr:hypothetical protein [Ochrobactrum sp. A-1]
MDMQLLGMRLYNGAAKPDFDLLAYADLSVAGGLTIRGAALVSRDGEYRVWPPLSKDDRKAVRWRHDSPFHEAAINLVLPAYRAISGKLEG